MTGRATKASLLMGALGLLVALPGVGLAAGTETSTTPADPLFRAVRPPDPVRLEPLRLLGRLPGELLELTFVPLIPLVQAVERYRIAERIIDVITNDELTFAAAPIIEPFNTSGLGLGAVVLQNEPLGSPDLLVAIGLVRLNGDRQLSVSLGRRLPGLSGRVVQVAGAYSVDRDIGWFGLGPDSELSDQRLLRRDDLRVTAGLSELFPNVINIDASFGFGYRRRGLSTGTGDQAPPLRRDGDVSVPPGFDRDADYLEGEAFLRFDTRDGLGRTTRGLVWSLSANGSHEVAVGSGGAPTGGVLGTSQFTLFLPVLPRNRVVVLSAGVSAALPLFDGDEVPLHQLVNLGGANTLRGYQPDRFIDRFGWWSSAEYRFLLSDYGGSLLGLSGAVFVDVGRVSRRFEDLVPGNLPWSVGLGLRFETDVLLLGRVQVALSPDGVRFSVGVGEWF